MPDQAPATQQATQTHVTPGIEDAASFSATPVAALGVLDTLHQSIGNRALGRMIESQRRAAGEGVTRITPWQQQQIEVIRRDGSDLQGAPGVRVHNDANTAAMASTLRARAFTQGNDVFFGPGYAADTEAGRDTLAHELTHVSEGRAVAGTVQKDDEPNASVPPPDATMPEAEETYTINLSTGTVSGLSEEAARNILYNNASQLASVISLYKGEHQSIYDLRHQGFFLAIGAAFTNLAGDPIPEMTIWVDAESKLATAEANIGGGDMTGAAAGLKDANDAYMKAAEQWQKFKEQLDSAAYKAQMEIIIVAAVLTVVVVAAAVVTAVGGAVGAGAAGGGAGTGTAGAAGAVSGTAATVPLDAAAAGAATTAVDVGAATLPGAAAGAAPAAAGAAAAPAAAGGAAAAGGGAVAAVAADAVIGQTITAMAAGGEAAVAEVAAGWSAEMLIAAISRIAVILQLNPAVRTVEMEALRRAQPILINIQRASWNLPR